MSAPSATIRAMLEAGVHFGHQRHRWNPKMRPFIYGERNGIHVIDLEQSSKALDRACEFARQSAAERKNIVFVGTKRQAAEIIEDEAKRCSMHFVNRRWLGGMLTNFETIRLRIARMKQLEEMKDSGELYRRPKKELAVLNRELFKLEKSLGGLRKLRGRPDILFVVDVKKEAIAVHEAIKAGVRVIAIVDTNSDPEGIDFVIPANDDSIRSIKLIVRAIADAILGAEPHSSDADPEGPDFPPAGVPRRPLPATGGAEVALPLPDFEDEP